MRQGIEYGPTLVYQIKSPSMHGSIWYNKLPPEIKLLKGETCKGSVKHLLINKMAVFLCWILNVTATYILPVIYH